MQFWSLAVVISGILNRVLYKMALKPLSNYTIFLAQFQTLAYTAIYFVVLFFKVRCGCCSVGHHLNFISTCCLSSGYPCHDC